MDFSTIFQNNERWIAERLSSNPDYFTNLAKGQNPEFLYIGFPKIQGWVFDVRRGRLMDLELKMEKEFGAIRQIYDLKPMKP